MFSSQIEGGQWIIIVQRKEYMFIMSKLNNINVANNVAQRNLQDLTELWKKGELEKGKKYWCKLQDGKSEICYLWLQTNHFTSLVGYQSRCLPDEDIVEVLAPVPSYKEWKEMKEQRDACAWALDKIGDVLVKHKLVKK